MTQMLLIIPIVPIPIAIGIGTDKKKELDRKTDHRSVVKECRLQICTSGGITCIEANVNWLHSDVRCYRDDLLLIV